MTLLGVADIKKRLEVIRQAGKEGTHGMIVGPSLAQAMDAAIVCLEELERLQRPKPETPDWFREPLSYEVPEGVKLTNVRVIGDDELGKAVLTAALVGSSDQQIIEALLHRGPPPVDPDDAA